MKGGTACFYRDKKFAVLQKKNGFRFQQQEKNADIRKNFLL